MGAAAFFSGLYVCASGVNQANDAAERGSIGATRSDAAPDDGPGALRAWTSSPALYPAGDGGDLAPGMALDVRF
jgi:hypothetical protein